MVKRKQKRKYTKRKLKPKSVDKVFLSLVLILVFIGLIAISSAGIAVSQSKFGDPYYYFKHQLFYGILPGLVAMFITSKINYKLWRKLAVLIF